jgi:hypothetical protein
MKILTVHISSDDYIDEVLDGIKNKVAEGYISGEYPSWKLLEE